MGDFARGLARIAQIHGETRAGLDTLSAAIFTIAEGTEEKEMNENELTWLMDKLAVRVETQCDSLLEYLRQRQSRQYRLLCFKRISALKEYLDLIEDALTEEEGTR